MLRIYEVSWTPLENQKVYSPVLKSLSKQKSDEKESVFALTYIIYSNWKKALDWIKEWSEHEQTKEKNEILPFSFLFFLFFCGRAKKTIWSSTPTRATKTRTFFTRERLPLLWNLSSQLACSSPFFYNSLTLLSVRKAYWCGPFQWIEINIP